MWPPVVTVRCYAAVPLAIGKCFSPKCHFNFNRISVHLKQDVGNMTISQGTRSCERTSTRCKYRATANTCLLSFGICKYQEESYSKRSLYQRRVGNYKGISQFILVQVKCVIECEGKDVRKWCNGTEEWCDSSL